MEIANYGFGVISGPAFGAASSSDIGSAFGQQLTSAFGTFFSCARVFASSLASQNREADAGKRESHNDDEFEYQEAEGSQSTTPAAFGSANNLAQTSCASQQINEKMNSNVLSGGANHPHPAAAAGVRFNTNSPSFAQNTNFATPGFNNSSPTTSYATASSSFGTSRTMFSSTPSLQNTTPGVMNSGQAPANGNTTDATNKNATDGDREGAAAAQDETDMEQDQDQDQDQRSKYECLVCDRILEDEAILVCSIDYCPFRIHSSCLASNGTTYDDVTGNFICPLCAYSVTEQKHEIAKSRLANYLGKREQGSSGDCINAHAGKYCLDSHCSVCVCNVSRTKLKEAKQKLLCFLRLVTAAQKGRRRRRRSSRKEDEKQQQKSPKGKEAHKDEKQQQKWPKGDRFWSEEEAAHLTKWVNRFMRANGKRNLPWKRIREFGCAEFRVNREGIDLQEKWRRMQMQNKKGGGGGGGAGVQSQKSENVRKRRKRTPVGWSEGEEELLKNLVGSLGHHGRRNVSWQNILKAGGSGFSCHRTAVDLKDKWRRLQK